MNPIRWTESQSLVRLFSFIISISFAMDVFVPALPNMNQYFRVDNSVMQASLYLFMLTVAIGQLIIGPLADRHGRRPMMIVSALLFLLGSILSGLATSMTFLLLGRVIQAAGACGTYLLCFIIIRDNFSTNTCGRLFSILGGTNAIIASTAPIIGGVLLDATHDWRSGFYFLTALGVVMSLFAVRFIPNYPHAKHGDERLTFLATTKCILQNRSFRRYTLVSSSSLLGLYLFCALSPGILITQLHLSATDYGLWFGLNAFVGFVINMVAAKLTYHYPLQRIVNGGLCLMVASCCCLLILNQQRLALLSFMLPMLTLTVGISFAMGSATALALKDFATQAGTAAAFVGASQFGLAGIIGCIVAQVQPSVFALAVPVLMLSLLSLILIGKSMLPINLQNSAA